MDVKKKIEEIVEKIKSDDALKQKFTTDPIGAIEDLIGVDLPEDQIKQVVDGVTAKLGSGALGGIAEKLGGLFGGGN
jgi:cytidylate kinase